MSRTTCGTATNATVPILSAVFALMLACGDGPTPSRVDPREGTLSVLSGNHQAAEVGTLLPQPLVVLVRDLSGSPLQGVSVTLSGDAVGVETSTDAAGRASFRWRLLGTARVQHVTIEAQLRSRPSVSVAVDAMPGPTEQLVRLSIISTRGFVGDEVDTIAVIPRDRYGNVARPNLEWLVTKGGGSVRVLRPDTAHRAIWTLGSESGENEVTVQVSNVRQVFTATALREAFTPRVITVGGAHTCALTAAGVAYCWGDNGLGQLGIGQRIELAKSATKVATNHAFVSLVAGGLHTCGLTAAGEAYCWGANYSGQLGSLGETSVPVRVGVVPPLVELVAGSYHTCGLTRDGVVYCWGDNTLGQIGDGIDRSWAMSPGSTVTPPIAVGGALRFVSIGAAWATTCAIATTGETYCWGSNQDRELGAETATRCRIAADPYYNKTDYDAPCSTRPVRFDVGVRLASLTAYATDWCGVSVDGEIWCWGAGLIGSRNAAPRRFSKAWIVEHAVCGLEESASVSCWRPWSRPGVESPRPFGSTLALTDLSSSSHSCGLSRDAPREAFCWGANYRGEIGDGTTIYRPVPRRVLPPPP